jgi:putative membrane protein
MKFWRFSFSTAKGSRNQPYTPQEMGQMNEEAPKQVLDPRSNKADVGTQLAHQRTDMAMDRNYLAGERTLMAWIRTSLSMISFGFTIGKLGKVLQDIEYKGLLGNTRLVSTQTLAYSLVVLGTVALLAAALQHWRRVRDLRAMGLGHQFSITFIVALFLAAVGGFALSSLVMAL